MIQIASLVAGVFLAAVAQLNTPQLQLKTLPAGWNLPRTVDLSPEKGDARDQPTRVEVVQGRVSIPPALRGQSLRLQAAGFEPISLTPAQVANGGVVLRALGKIRGRIERPLKQERVLWIGRLAASSKKTVEEKELEVDTDGFVTLDRAAGVYDFVVLRRNHASKLKLGVVVEPGKTTELGVLPTQPGVGLSLSVIDSVSSRPIGNARVIWDPDPRHPSSAKSREFMGKRWDRVTDASGRVQIADLPEVVRFRIEATGYQPKTVTPPRQTPGRQADLGTVAIDRETTVSVIVERPAELESSELAVALVRIDTDEQGRRSPGKTLTKKVHLDRTPVVFDAISEGEFRVLLHRGRQLITLKDVLVDTGPLEVILSPRAKAVTGRVTRGGKPISEARVLATFPRTGSLEFAEDRTGYDGTFSIGVFHGGNLLLTALKDAASAFRQVDLSSRDEAVVDIEIPSRGIRGLVRDLRTGKPIPNARIALLFASQTSNAEMTSEIRSDENGLFTDEGMESGRIRLTISARGYRSKTVETFAQETDSAGLVIDLERSREGLGIVVDETGRRVSGATIEAEYAGPAFGVSQPPAYATRSDAEGRFRFDSPPPDGTLIYVTAPGYALSLAPLSTSAENTIVLSRPSGSSLIVRRANGESLGTQQVVPGLSGMPLPIGALETLAEAQGTHLANLCQIRSDGTVPIPRFLAPGRYRFFLRPADGPILVSVGELDIPLREPRVLIVHNQ